jgi:hypothetical protein
MLPIKSADINPDQRIIDFNARYSIDGNVILKLRCKIIKKKMKGI